MPDAKMSEPPTRPSTAMARGTSRERYIRYASSTVLTPSASFGPKRKVQLWTATSDWPTVTAVAASAPVVPARSWRIVTTASRLIAPTAMIVASMRRPAT